MKKIGINDDLDLRIIPIKINELIDYVEALESKSKHGYFEEEELTPSWLLRNCPHNNIVEQLCSVCHRWSIKFDDVIESEYCCHCGAKMDGKKVEE